MYMYNMAIQYIHVHIYSIRLIELQCISAIVIIIIIIERKGEDII